MKILVINSGSSSLKFQLFENGKSIKCLFKGMIDRIGLSGTKFVENGIEKGRIEAPDHRSAINLVFEILLKKKLIKTVRDITAIGHRVVHGGEKYRDATTITPAVLKEIKKLCELAPLHNPPNLASIQACMEILPKTPQIAVFDTAFHQTIPEKAYLYAIPMEYYRRFGIRRYGFHGTSHRFVANLTAELLRKKKSKIVICHLGNGSSVTAIENGKSVDTSMGFTPLEGLPMGTRCGDIDPAIVFELMEMLKVDTNEIDDILNKESGLKGFSGISSDMRDLWAVYKTDSRARLTISLLAYRIAKYIGAYAAAMNGLDAITFTAGMGEKAYYLRKEICDYLGFLGVKISQAKNKASSMEISKKGSKTKVFVIPTDEEKEIAMETAQILKKNIN
jgi:acetate kinase